ncbi:glycosyltransferase family 39 protein [Patescibacteria group bacterium]|nr:glycosyltransferase family 39 protein [Patescibacteria group bacterium]MBU1472920.1 glycosyltransferase family 39 protein [Patescibacteria group bacterium]MBU2460330.1 glycosyltransferase family 39 protein [Patescibacteria group bacterium]MBU2544057.1 glycosyltransferase family 39 protein [Patescibacteria group bacterium]
MKRTAKPIHRKPFVWGIVLVLVFLAIHLAVARDYGLTWDFHYHFFGGAKFLGYNWNEIEPRPLPYTGLDPRTTLDLPYGPIMSIPPVASFLLFSKALHLLPQDTAYNLPIILWGVAGIGVLYVFMYQAFSPGVAIVAALFLALTPRYFADLHNNMKDIPSAVVFALNMWLVWRLVRFRRLKDLILAAVGFAIAFNVKVNSIFIPVIFAVWLMVQKTQKVRIFWYFLLAPLAALLLWSLFWPDPIGQLMHMITTFGVGTDNIEVLLNGHWYCSGKNVPWYYPYWYLAITTPLVLLVFFLIGLIRLIRHIRPIGLLLLLWFFLPLTRYLIPKIGVIDGIRHFEEVLFPLSALAAIGADHLIRWIKNRRCIPNALHQGILTTFLLFTFYFLLFTIYSYHPYQITYYNELVGGIKGAFGKYDLDYWGSSQKQAVLWLNGHAPKNSVVNIVMAADVAGTYLRPDLLSRLNTTGISEADFTVVLNRQSFFYRYHITDYIRMYEPAYTVETQGVPLVWIYDNKRKKETLQEPWWGGEDPCIAKYWVIPPSSGSPAQ